MEDDAYTGMIGGYVAVDGPRVVWTSQHEYTIRIRTYDTDGHSLWERLVPIDAPPPEVENGGLAIQGWGLRGFAMQTDGRVAISGDFRGGIDFGDGRPHATPAWEGFFALYDP